MTIKLKLLKNNKKRSCNVRYRYFKCIRKTSRYKILFIADEMNKTGQCILTESVVPTDKQIQYTGTGIS